MQAHERAACELGWIIHDGTCNSLRAKLDAARNSIIAGNSRAAAGQIGALLNELEAQRNEKVNERAYMLLSTNAEYLLGRL